LRVDDDNKSYAARGLLLFSAFTYARTPFAAGDDGPEGLHDAATTETINRARIA
jgi:hypothetical protein